MRRFDVPHRVYRCYDDSGRLVYIGATSQSIAARMRQHRSQRPRVWAATVRVETVDYPNWETAHAAEGAAIFFEMPLLNRQHNWRRYPSVETPRVETTRDRKWAAHRELALAAERASP